MWVKWIDINGHLAAWDTTTAFRITCLKGQLMAFGEANSVISAANFTTPDRAWAVFDAILAHDEDEAKPFDVREFLEEMEAA